MSFIIATVRGKCQISGVEISKNRAFSLAFLVAFPCLVRGWEKHEINGVEDREIKHAEFPKHGGKVHLRAFPSISIACVCIRGFLL